MENEQAKPAKEKGAKKADKQNREKVVISAADVVSKIRTNRPTSLRGLDDTAAVRLVREVLSELGAQLNASGEGAVQVTGLGVFAISQRTKEGEAGGEAAGKSKKRIVFKAKGKDSAEKAAKKTEKKAAKKDKKGE